MPEKRCSCQKPCFLVRFRYHISADSLKTGERNRIPCGSRGLDRRPRGFKIYSIGRWKMEKKSNQIQVPNVENEYMRRTADALLVSAKERVLILNAGAGYGKTQMLAYYVKHCEIPCAWYSLSGADNELMSFVRNFTKSVAGALRIGDADMQIFLSPEEDLDLLVEKLVVWLDMWVENLYIILDDFQEIHNPDIFNLVNVLLETLGEKLRFFIVEMRSLPDFLEEYASLGTAACIEAEDLKFTKEEIELLLRYVTDTDLQRQAAELIYDHTEGWPVGVIQITQQMRRQQKKMTADGVEQICRTLEVSDYLTKRVYKMLPFEIQTFLKRTAVLDYMTAPVCNAVIGNYQSESLLKYLVKEKLFVQSLGEKSGIYRYHSIFQRFLLSQMSEQEQTDSLKKAAYFFLKTEDKIQAAEYGCRANAPEVVQAVLEVSGEEILKDRLYDTLHRCFTFLEQREATLLAKVRFIYGKYLRTTGNTEEARRQILEAGKDFYKEGRIADYKKALLYLAASDRREGNLRQAAYCLRQAEQFPEKGWNTLEEAVCTERIKQECCLQRRKEAQQEMEAWQRRGARFLEGSFLFAAWQIFGEKILESETERAKECEEGFLLSDCIFTEKLAAVYHEADYQSVLHYANRILQDTPYETLHTAIAWKMLALLSWNKKNYRKAVEQAEMGDKFLYKNQIQLQDFVEKHRYVLEEMDFLKKNTRNIRPLLLQEELPLYEEKEEKLRIQCMKQFCVIFPDGEEIKWRTKKAQELFAYLFHLQGESVTREELITLLWPEIKAKSAAALFHTTLYSIRQGFLQKGWENLIQYEKRKYSLHMERITSDLEELQKFFRTFSQKQEKAEWIWRLYPGGYMEDTGYLWAYGRAKKLEDAFLSVCKESALDRMARRQEAQAVPFLQSIQEMEPYDEEMVTRLIFCLYRSGKQKEAKQQYDRMVKLYKEDLELDFEKTFHELIQV